MRSWKLCCDVEFEASIVLSHLIAYFNHFCTCLDFNVHIKNSIKHRVYDFFCVFIKKRESILDRHFKLSAHVLWIWCWLQDFQIWSFLHFLNPNICLHLGINEKWPFIWVFKNDCIFCWNIISWKSLNSPFSNFNLVSKNIF